MAAHRAWQDVATGDFVSVRRDVETTASYLIARGSAARELAGAGMTAPESAPDETGAAETTDIDTTGIDTTGTDPTGTDPTGTDPTGTDTAGTDPADAGPDWTRIGIVVRPADVGLPQLESLVVFLADGSVGELLPTLRTRTSAELAITAGPEAVHEMVIATLHQAVAAADAYPVDEAGAAIVDRLSTGSAGTAGQSPAPAASPGRPDTRDRGRRVRTLLDRATGLSGGSHQLEVFARRCALDGNKLPCPVHSYDAY